MPLYLDEIWLQWRSAEEARRVLTTFGAFSAALARGFIARRRLAPIVEWSAVATLADTLPTA